MPKRPVPSRKRPERSTLVRTLVVLSFVTHLSTGLAWTGALSLAGVTWGWMVAFPVAIVLALAVRSRLAPLLWDRPRGAMERHLETAFLAEWCASLGAFPLVLVGVLVSFAVDLARGAELESWRWAAAGGYATGLLFSVYGVYLRRAWVLVRRLDVPVRDLPHAFEGFKVVHLSDLHLGGLLPDRTRRAWVQLANREDANLIAVTGDLVTSGTAFHGEVATFLAALKAEHGVALSFGNHDYFDNADLAEKIAGVGVRVLKNESYLLRAGEHALRIAGVDDTWTGRADLPRTLEGDPLPTVLLCHDPDLFDHAEELGADLVLAGHTHAGQIAVPFFSRKASLANLAHDYTHGLYTRNDASLFVSAGLGTTGPPIRVGAAPEVVVITLRRRTT